MKRRTLLGLLFAFLGVFFWPVRAGAAASPTGHWRFDEGSGTTAADSSGNGHDGTLVNGPLWTTGRIGQGLSFNGVANRVDVAHAPDLNVYPLSIAAWFKTSSTSGDRGLVNKYVASSYNGYNLFLNDGRLCAWYIRDGSNFVYDGSGCTFHLTGYNDGQWHHAVYVVDASGASLYVDGVEKGALGWTGAAGAVSTTEPVHVGYYPGAYGGAEYFDGVADDVRIYQGALTPAEVADLYDNQVTRYVDNLGPCAGAVPCYATIMDAVHAAGASDVIEVFPGVYHEAVTLPSSSSLVLRAHQEKLRPVIVAPDGGSSAVTIGPGRAQILNFVLEGSVVHEPGASGAVIEGNLITGSIGFHIAGGCTVRNNTIRAGGVSISSGGSCLIEGNTMSDGMISVRDGFVDATGITIRNNVVRGIGISGTRSTGPNTVESNLVAGGISISGAYYLTGNVISNNTVRGGGIGLSGSTVGGGAADNRIESNFVSGSTGDGIRVEVGDGARNVIRENTAVENAGCDINDMSGPSVVNTWEDNRFGTSCGAATH